jgi:hypothetical protein
MSAQVDTIFLKKNQILTGKVKVISETQVLFDTAQNLDSVNIVHVIRIKYANNHEEYFRTEKPEFNAEIPPELRESLEKRISDGAKKTAACAISGLESCYTTIDWGMSRRDIFKPSQFIIIAHVIYERRYFNDRSHFNIAITLNESSKKNTWRLLSLSNPSDERPIVKCMKRSLP